MEFDLVRNPHPHPLIFYREGKPDGQGICCSKCSQLFSPPAFACSNDNCNFHIHQSCIDLPHEILSPFHTHDPQIQTPLSLTRTNNFCNCCGQFPYGKSYCCSKRCGFAMDVQCAIANPKANSLLKTTGGREFRHFSNPHPLTLHRKTDPERGSTIPVCLVCQHPITSPSTYYFCSRSLSHGHSYTLHPQILYPNLHLDHPLFLFALPWRTNTTTFLCLCCKSECVKFYSCRLCNFNLHVNCVSSFKHEHDFRILRNKLFYKCQICLKSNEAFPWICTICRQFAHEKCAIRQMSHHRHQDLSSQISNEGPLASPNNNSIINLQNGIQHFSHKQHKLTLCLPHKDMHCDGCMQRISALSQSCACLLCGFYLHEECAKLPTQRKNSFLHPHELSMIYIPDFVFSCAHCLQYCHGFAYRCGKCYYIIDIRCAAITFPFKHPSHHHPSTYYHEKVMHSCRACGECLKNKKVIGCEDCEFYLDVRCAHLPRAVRNRFDEHPLILTFVNENKNNNDVYENCNYEDYKSNVKGKSEEGAEYYCDVCEEKRNVNEWFYNCRLCCFAAHTNCVLRDYPFLKSAKFKNHLHPLSLVNECKKRYSSRSF